tara:strand:- start:369 stop:536 length:168 start_codon:yes stop_codon:yes gene_type:complete
MEIETKNGDKIIVGNMDRDNEIEIVFEDEYDWITIDNVKQLIAHLQEQVDKHGTI